MPQREEKEEDFVPQYIGGGVYVHFDGFHMRLRAEQEHARGIVIWHEIALDPHAWEKLCKFQATLKNT